jgi:hypothetical protein
MLEQFFMISKTALGEERDILIRVLSIRIVTAQSDKKAGKIMCHLFHIILFILYRHKTDVKGTPEL